MTVKIDESGFCTLKLFLLSCHSTLGDEALRTFFKFKGSFPCDLRDTLKEFSWVVEKLSGNIFKRLEEYAKQVDKTELSSEDICLFFGGEDHLFVVMNSCIVYLDLTKDERTAGHLTLPVIVTDVYEGKVSGKVTYKNIFIQNIVNVFEDVKEGDIVLVHFATVVLPNPSQALLSKLTDIQQDFSNQHLSKINSLIYKDTFANTKEKIQKYY